LFFQGFISRLRIAARFSGFEARRINRACPRALQRKRRGRKPSRCRSAFPLRLARSTMSNSASDLAGVIFSWFLPSLSARLARKKRKRNAGKRRTNLRTLRCGAAPTLALRDEGYGRGQHAFRRPTADSRQRSNATAQLQLTRFLGRSHGGMGVTHPLPPPVQRPLCFSYHLRCRRKGADRS
jgi:hypothetical protein